MNLTPYVFLFSAITSVTMATENPTQEVLMANQAFAKKLYRTVANAADSTDNIFMSPISAHTILSLVYQGATGRTEREMGSVLGLKNKEDSAMAYENITKSLNSLPAVTLTTANKIFLSPTVNVLDKFEEVATENFLSRTESVDFKDNVKAAKIINDWVGNKTGEKIKDVISSETLNDKTNMLLVNAMYFKGMWENAFQKYNTKMQDFWLSETEKKHCSMMFQQSDFRYAEIKELDAQLLELPYMGGQTNMLIILPRTKTGISVLEEKLSNLDLGSLAHNMTKEAVKVHLPKFKIEHTIDLKPVLEKMGMGTMFTENAELSEIAVTTTNNNLHVTDAVQKTFIGVDEEGTEAAAATGFSVAVKVALTTRNRPPVEFRADRPFFLAIMHQRSTVLFAGRLRKG